MAHVNYVYYLQLSLRDLLGTPVNHGRLLQVYDSTKFYCRVTDDAKDSQLWADNITW